MERSASIFKYYGNKFINDKMKKAKKNEEKLKKTRNKINQLSQKDIIDNNISILFSKKIPLLRNIKINNKTPIPNSPNLNKSSTFPQISNEQPPQPIYNQIPILL